MLGIMPQQKRHDLTIPITERVLLALLSDVGRSLFE